MSSGMLTAFISSLTVALLFLVMRKVAPAPRPPEGVARPTTPPAGYLAWSLLVFVLFACSTAALGFVWWGALLEIGHLRAGFLPSADFTYTPMRIFWAIPAMFLGMGGACVALSVLAKHAFKGEKYQAYLEYDRLRAPFDSEKAVKILARLIAAGSACWVILGLDNYVQLDGGSLIVNGFLSIGAARHDLSGIREIRTAPKLTAPNGNIVARREYSIRFENGTKWTTQWIPEDISPEEKARFAETISKRSGVAIQELELFEKSEIY